MEVGYACEYVCMQVMFVCSMSVCIDVRPMHVRMFIYARMPVCMRACMYVFIYVCVCIYSFNQNPVVRPQLGYIKEIYKQNVCICNL